MSRLKVASSTFVLTTDIKTAYQWFKQYTASQMLWLFLLVWLTYLLEYFNISNKCSSVY